MTDTTIATTCKRSKVILLDIQKYTEVTIVRGVHALITSRSHKKCCTMNASIITGSQWNTFYKDQVTAEIRDHNTITGLHLGNQ